MEAVEFPRNANPQRNQNVLVPPSNLKYKSSWIKYPYRKSAIFKLSKKKLCTDLQGRWFSHEAIKEEKKQTERQKKEAR